MKPKSLLRKIILSMSLSVGLVVSPISGAASNNTEFTLYLVRHAEKSPTPSNNPNLTECGKQRAQYLSEYFSTKSLSKIFSTNTQRTQQTAAPTAIKLGISVIPYDHRQLKALANTLKQDQNSALIVGHSNTTSDLASELTGKKIAWLQHNEFDVIFQIEFNQHGVKLNRSTQNFSCKTPTNLAGEYDKK